MSAMRVTALDRKFLRDVGRLKGQVLTIALVLAGGIASFIALRGTYASLERSRDAYYDRQRFAHVFARARARARDRSRARIEALPGVASVQTRISKEVSLPIEGMARPASGRLLSLPDAGEPRHERAAPAQRAPARARIATTRWCCSSPSPRRTGCGPGDRSPP